MIEAFVSDKNLSDYCSVRHELTVRGVFSAGVYLSDDDGRVIMLHDARYGALPFGLAVPDMLESGCLKGIRAEARAVLDNCILSIENAKIIIHVMPDIKPVIIPEKLNIEPFLSEAVAALKKAEAPYAVYSGSSVEDIKKDDIEDIFARTAYSGMQLLTEGMINSEREKIRAALEKLLGLGRGLTPSCDDFITGAMFYLKLAEKSGMEIPPSAEMLSAEITALAAVRTNIYSGAYLLAAAAGGDFSLMRACAENPCEKTIKELLSVGSSSGSDMLAGMCFSAAMLSRQKFFN